MMTSSNGNIFRVTGPLYEEFTGHWWIPHKGQWRGAFMFSLICAWISGWVNKREPGDLRRHRAHYSVIVMKCKVSWGIFVDLGRLTRSAWPRVVHVICHHWITQRNEINEMRRISTAAPGPVHWYFIILKSLPSTGRSLARCMEIMAGRVLCCLVSGKSSFCAVIHYK